MKVLIGTPVHQNKDQYIKKWLQNAAQLSYPADLLLVDSSPGNAYQKILKEYCRKFGIKNYYVKHLKISQEKNTSEQIGRSREIIRQEILSKDYAAWFSWECEQNLPQDTLTKLIKIMQAGNFALISHLDQNEFSEKPLDNPADNLASTLVSRSALEKFGFLLEYPDMPDCWYKGGTWFKKQIIASGGKYLEVNTKNINKTKKYRGKNKLKLNLGCGDKHIKGYINIDILDPCDLKHDLRKIWPFDNDSADTVFSEGNTICLFSQKEWLNLKKEMARVLKIGGRLELIFFDLIYILRAFLKDQEGQRWNYWWRTIFSAQKDQYDYSKNGFTYQKIITDLSQEGFTGFTKMKPPEPGCTHLVCYKYRAPSLDSERNLSEVSLNGTKGDKKT